MERSRSRARYATPCASTPRLHLCACVLRARVRAARGSASLWRAPTRVADRELTYRETDGGPRDADLPAGAAQGALAASCSPRWRRGDTAHTLLTLPRTVCHATRRLARSASWAAPTWSRFRSSWAPTVRVTPCHRCSAWQRPPVACADARCCGPFARAAAQRRLRTTTCLPRTAWWRSRLARSWQRRCVHAPRSRRPACAADQRALLLNRPVLSAEPAV
jgi:hypothetical protein